MFFMVHSVNVTCCQYDRLSSHSQHWRHKHTNVSNSILMIKPTYTALLLSQNYYHSKTLNSRTCKVILARTSVKNHKTKRVKV